MEEWEREVRFFSRLEGLSVRQMQELVELVRKLRTVETEKSAMGDQPRGPLGDQIHTGSAEACTHEFCVSVRSKDRIRMPEQLVSMGYERCTPALLEKYPKICAEEDLDIRLFSPDGSHWHKMYFSRTVKNSRN